MSPWPRRLVAVLAPDAVDGVVRSLLRSGIAPSRVTLLGPGRFYGDLPRGLRVRQGRRVLPRREAMAVGGVIGAFGGAVIALTAGTLLAHAAVAWPALPLWSVIPRVLGGMLVSSLWVYAALLGVLAGAPLGAIRGMPPTLAARCDDALAHGDILVAVLPPPQAAPRIRTILEQAGGRSVRLCYGDLRPMGQVETSKVTPEDDPRRWPG